MTDTEELQYVQNLFNYDVIVEQSVLLLIRGSTSSSYSSPSFRYLVLKECAIRGRVCAVVCIIIKAIFKHFAV